MRSNLASKILSAIKRSIEIDKTVRNLPGICLEVIKMDQKQDGDKIGSVIRIHVGIWYFQRVQGYAVFLPGAMSEGEGSVGTRRMTLFSAFGISTHACPRVRCLLVRRATLEDEGSIGIRRA